jgi:uncharacterized protein
MNFDFGYSFWIVQVIMFLGSVIVAITGFGGGIVRMPLFLQFLPLSFAAPLENINGFLNNFLTLDKNFWKTNKILLSFLLFGNIIGSFVGAYLLKTYGSNKVILAIIGVVIVSWEGILIYEALVNKKVIPTLDNLKILYKNTVALPTGLLSGLMSGVFSVGGPPLVIFMRLIFKDNQEIRRHLLVFFLFNGFIQVIALSLAGLLTVQMWLTSILSMPSLYAGTWCGKWLLKKITNKGYKHVVSFILIFNGLSLITKSTQ